MRITIESNTEIQFKHSLLSYPERLVLDLQSVELSSTLKKFINPSQRYPTYIKALRISNLDPKTVRLVIEPNLVVIPHIFILPPEGRHQNRLIIDVYPQYDKDPLMDLVNLAIFNEKKEKLIPDKIAADLSFSILTKAPAVTPKRLVTIAVDPGHGGEDPGSIGSNGSHEKTIVLAIAKKLRILLENIPYVRVIMTREADSFVSLGQRVRKARLAKADLFVSIHADAFVTPKAYGCSVFVLSEHGATSSTAKWLAQHENNADLIGGIRVNTIDRYLAHTLLSLTQTATIKESLKLGKLLLSQLKSVNALNRAQIEQANFAVLKSPDVPSVLVETGFISNPEEEQRLIDPHYQQKIATVLFNGIERYIAQNAHFNR